MKGWFRRSTRVTAATARRITGISVPFGGIQWANPGPTNTEVVRKFFIFLEDRRVLYNENSFDFASAVGNSISQIRGECTKVLQKLSPNTDESVLADTINRIII